MRSSWSLIHNSLKEKTREKRRQGKAPIQYKIADDTNIKHIPIARFLSHEKTKADLTDYLAKAILDYKRNRFSYSSQQPRVIPETMGTFTSKITIMKRLTYLSSPWQQKHHNDVLMHNWYSSLLIQMSWFWP